MAAWDKYFTRVLVDGATVKIWHTSAELRWVDEAKKCSVKGCGLLTHWRRPWANGAATHPMCEGGVLFDRADDALYAQALSAVMADLPVAAISLVMDTPRATTDGKVRALGNPRAGCSRCGRAYAAPWVVARTWRCGDHPPADEEYRRRW